MCCGPYNIILLTHLLKLAVAARHRPNDLARAGRDWRTTCRTQRRLLAKRLRRNPSLRPTLPEECAEAYEIARDEAATALEVDEMAVSLTCPWTPEQVLDEAFWPEGGPTTPSRPSTCGSSYPPNARPSMAPICSTPCCTGHGFVQQ